MNRYVITYFTDPAESDTSDLQTVFMEGFTEDDVRDKFLAKFGTFADVVSLNLTKSCGGPGLHENTVNVSGNVFYNNVLLEETITLTSSDEDKEVKAKEKVTVKVVNRGGKISNASQIRMKIAEAKASGQDKNFVVDWAVATLGQTKPVAKSYVKNIWSE